MPIIAGLGNIGAEYEGTRHNIGFDIVRRLAETLSVDLRPGPGPFLCGVGRHRGKKTILLTPTTYMNNSGKAITKALAYYGVAPEDCLVCCDDINLPTGTIRMRKNGGSGGHNGLSDIIETIGSTEFPRLRFGIGDNFSRGKQADYVLSPFPKDEHDHVAVSLHNAHDGALCFVREGIEQAMNKYNG
ncbi:MAG: aminoacyl-tRNA hydrolase [Balneolaceae bacterium]|jgi:PTH1 family peptidyl-tRNA hydrolase|nr:MAG: aminoacyl-tRNA hydrolase [Balneolaceae bacterium]